MPLFWLSLAFLAGIPLAAALSWSTLAWLGSGAALLLGAGAWGWLGKLWRRRGLPAYSIFLHLHIHRRISAPLSWLFAVTSRLPLPGWLLALALLLGAARYAAAQPALQPGFVAWYNDDRVVYLVEGVLVEPPDERDGYTNLRVSVEQLQPEQGLDSVPVSGLLLAKAPPGGDWRYGDRLRLQGRLETPPADEGFSYREYLARQGVYSLMRNASGEILQRDQGNPLLAAIYALKNRAHAHLYRLYPDPEASLLAGILLGIESGIPQQVKEAFEATGTSHIIAISG